MDTKLIQKMIEKGVDKSIILDLMLDTDLEKPEEKQPEPEPEKPQNQPEPEPARKPAQQPEGMDAVLAAINKLTGAIQAGNIMGHSYQRKEETTDDILATILRGDGGDGQKEE